MFDSLMSVKNNIKSVKQLHIKAQNLKDKLLIQNQHNSRKPLVPLFVTPPLPKVQAIRTKVSCSHHPFPDSDIYYCDSANFTSLQFDQCDIKIKYTYTVINEQNQTAILKRLIDGSFSDIVDQSLLLLGNSEVSYEKNDTIDICRDAEITQRVVGIGSLMDDANNEEVESTTFARNSITYLTP